MTNENFNAKNKIALNDEETSKSFDFTGMKLVRVDSEGRLWIDFGNAKEAPIQSIVKNVNTFTLMSNGVGTIYLPIEGAVSVAGTSSAFNHQALMPRLYKVVKVIANARISTLGAGESIDLILRDDASDSSVVLTFDGDTYTADDEIESDFNYDMVGNMLCWKVDPTLAGAGTLDNIHIGLELVPLEV